MGKLRLAMIDVGSGDIYYYQNDHLGTPQIMTDDTNTVVWEADYMPFGEANVSPNSIVVNNFRFPGQYYDEETGLHYNWNRYYEPKTGRYLTPDVLNLATFSVPIYLKRFLREDSIHISNEYLLSVGSHIKWYFMDEILSVYSYVLNDPIKFIDEAGDFKGRPSDIIRFLLCAKGLIQNAKNIERFREECRKECDPETGSENSMYKCALRKTWHNFEKCLKFALPGG